MYSILEVHLSPLQKTFHFENIFKISTILCQKLKKKFLTNKTTLEGSRNINKNIFKFYFTKLTTY